MTTNPKTRKAPAKRAASKAATKQASGAKPEIGVIVPLIARWRFLEAEEVYLASIAPDEESDAALCKHQREQDEIETKLSRSIPQDFEDVRELLEFATVMIKEGDRPDHGGQMMLGNIFESLPEVFSGEKEAARKTGMEKMRGIINFMTENANNLLDAELTRSMF